MLNFSFMGEDFITYQQILNRVLPAHSHTRGSLRIYAYAVLLFELCSHTISLSKNIYLVQLKKYFFFKVKTH